MEAFTFTAAEGEMDAENLARELAQVDFRAIAGLMLRQVAARLEERAIHLTWDGEVEEKLSREGYDVKFGARPLRRLIQREVEDAIASEIIDKLRGVVRRVGLTAKDGKIEVLAV